MKASTRALLVSFAWFMAAFAIVPVHRGDSGWSSAGYFVLTLIAFKCYAKHDRVLRAHDAKQKQRERDYGAWA